jgi:6-phosphogluconolactonase
MRGTSSPDEGKVQTLVSVDRESLAEEAAALVLGRIGEAFRARRSARIILAGGGTPRETYRLLGSRILEEKLPVERLLWFFGDERWVASDHPQSNERMARETLLGRIRAPESTIFTWSAGAGDPVECAGRYRATARRLMGREGSRPDVLLLGIGADGHTASLFHDGTAYLPGGGEMPVSPDIPVEAAAVSVPRLGAWRLTLCPLFLRTSRCVVFLVSGADKEAALRRAREGDPSVPASWIRGGATFFLATRDALGPERDDREWSVRHA